MCIIYIHICVYIIYTHTYIIYIHIPYIIINQSVFLYSSYWSCRLTRPKTSNWFTSWRPRRANGLVPVSVQRKSLSVSAQDGKNTSVLVQGSQVGGLSLTQGRISCSVLFRPSIDWMSPTHTHDRGKSASLSLLI